MWIIISIVLAVALLISLWIQVELKTKISECKFHNELLIEEIRNYMRDE